MIEEEAEPRTSRGLTVKHLSKKGVSLHIIRHGEQKEARKDPAAFDGGAEKMEVFHLSGGLRSTTRLVTLSLKLGQEISKSLCLSLETGSQP